MKAFTMKPERTVCNNTTTQSDSNSSSGTSIWARSLSQVCGGVALNLCLSLIAATQALATNYSFTKIADTKSDFLGISSTPAINDSGTAAFVATPEAGRGVYTSNGEQIVEITKIVNVRSLPTYSDTRPSLSSIVDINNNGTVVFSVDSTVDQGETIKVLPLLL